METPRVSCTRCDNQILPQTAARNNGLCGVCARKLAKSSQAAAAKLALLPDPKLQPWLDQHLASIDELLTNDIREHTSWLARGGIDFYGYAILPEDYTTITDSDAPSLTVAFNRDSDLAEEHADSVYYRYSPDEWENYVHTGFEKTNALLKNLYADFLKQFYQNPGQRVCNNNRGAFFDHVHQRYLKSLQRLRADGTFASSIFLVIWISDSTYQIIVESARVLNLFWSGGKCETREG